MKILIDNGHGRETPGKCSPDGHFKEYQYTREIAAAVVARLQYRDYDAELLVPEFEDIPLKERVKRVNRIWDKSMAKHSSCPTLPSASCPTRSGISPVILISIHVDAAGSDGQWHNASGWSCYTSPGQTRGDELATYLYHAAEHYLPGRKIRTDYSDGDPDREAGFFILNRTKCPAALVECGFMDNRAELEFLESAEGRKAMVGVVVEGVVSYLND